MIEKSVLALILSLFLLLGITYAVVTPVFEASDELWHYPMVRHLADGNPLPVQDPSNVGPWKQQASQPPLYYYLAAALTFPIDTSDIDQVRRLNPHVDNGVLTADGNVNLVVHNPAANQWQGTLLAVHVIRLASVLLGAAAVYLTYRIGREAAPDRPEVALGAAAIHAFTPMFLFISGAVNNDNLVVPLVSLALLLMIRLVTTGRRPSLGWLLGLGVVVGLAALAKYPGLALLPMAFGALFVSGWARSERRLTAVPGILGRAIGKTAVVALPFIAIAGWWYYRNRVLYGDWLGWSAFFQVLGVRATPASLAQLWDERWGFMASYWGLFGGVNVPMPLWIYALLNGVAVVGAVGLVGYLVVGIGNWGLGIGDRPARAGLSNIQYLISSSFDFVVRHFALVVCLIWSAATVAGLVRWATTTWSSQGRLVFAAISPLSVLLALGWVGLLRRRPSRWIMAGLGTFLFAVAALAPWLWIRPAYQPERYQPPGVIGPLQPVGATFDGAMRLVGYRLADHQPLQPGGVLDLVLEWQVLDEMENDWSVFVHLNDPLLGAPIAQRDMYPRQGLRATTMLRPGDRFADYYRLAIPRTAVAPAQLQLAAGLYDYETADRLPLAGGGDAAVLAELSLAAAPGDVPNPISVRFEDALELVGFEVAPRRAEAGETIEVTLYWRPLRRLSQEYTFFAQIVDAETTRWAADDRAPAPATTDWPPGEVQSVQLLLTLAGDTPTAVYPLIVGAYTRAPDGGFDRLQTVTGDGRLTDDFLLLTPVRVGE